MSSPGAPGRVAIAWSDLILAAFVVVCGAGLWAAAQRAVTFALHESAPVKQEYLARDAVRRVELELKTVQEELDATRKKWIEQRLGGAAPDQLGAAMAALQNTQILVERRAADARRQALRDYEHEDLRFKVRVRSLTLLCGVLAVAVGAVLVYAIGSVAARRLGVQPFWRVAMALAFVVLAPVVGFETAGAAGAVVATLAVLWLAMRMQRR